jgi:AcrR family transcriptional regulator
VSEERPEHGPPTFVARDDRERLFLAAAAVVSEQGLENTTVAAVAHRAGCSVDEFSRHFASVEECVLAAFESAADQAFAAAAGAALATRGTWGEAIHAGLAALLDFLAGSPKLTRMCTVDALQAGAAALELRDIVLDRFAEVLEPGYAARANPLPATVSEAVSGGLYEVVRSHALEGRLAELPDALPEMTVIALAPFLGSAEAERLALSAPRVRAVG